MWRATQPAEFVSPSGYPQAFRSRRFYVLAYPIDQFHAIDIPQAGGPAFRFIDVDFAKPERRGDLCTLRIWVTFQLGVYKQAINDVSPK